MQSVQLSPRSSSHGNSFSNPYAQQMQQYNNYDASTPVALHYLQSNDFPNFPSMNNTPINRGEVPHSIHMPTSADLYPNPSDLSIISDSPLPIDNYLIERKQSIDSLSLELTTNYIYPPHNPPMNIDSFAASSFQSYSFSNELLQSAIPNSGPYYVDPSNSLVPTGYFGHNDGVSVSESLALQKKRPREYMDLSRNRTILDSPTNSPSPGGSKSLSPIASSGSSVGGSDSQSAGRSPTALMLRPSSPSNSSDDTQIARSKKQKGYLSKYSSLKSLKSEVSAEEIDRRRKLHRKEQHQITDRQRRAKIKECMEKLKSMLPVHIPKADQATIASETVEYLTTLQEELADLKRMLARQKAIALSPTLGMASGLNSAGVSIVRLSLDCRIIEVNMVFEMGTGFSFAELRDRCPAHPPLNATTAVVPKEFSKFSGCIYVPVTATVEVDENEAQFNQPNNRITEVDDDMAKIDTTKETLVTERTSRKETVHKVVSCVLSSCRTNSANGFESFTSMPIIPVDDLVPFFPFKRADVGTVESSAVLTANSKFLLESLRQLPPQHSLQMLTRIQISNGDIMEAIQVFTVTRDMDNVPDSLLCMTTPEFRRILAAGTGRKNKKRNALL